MYIVLYFLLDVYACVGMYNISICVTSHKHNVYWKLNVGLHKYIHILLCYTKQFINDSRGK